jgi:Raf kinase inhibitor-like YbhB/YbcL family protein
MSRVTEPVRLASVAALACLLVACVRESPVATSINVTSPAFGSNAAIPARYTCSGADVSPPISWTGTPGNAESIALTVVDPDAPGKPFVHWVVFNMPASTTELPEGGPAPDGSAPGRNDFGSNGYRGPCPPPGAPHHYHFKVYALDTKLSLRSGASESAFEDAIKGHVLGMGELIGTFRR